MPDVETRAPARAPGLELLGRMEGSGFRDAPGTVRRADGQTVQVTPLLYQLLEVLDGQRDLGKLAEALGEACGKRVEAEDVRTLLEEKLAPLGLVCHGEGSTPAVAIQPPLLALRCKFVISDPAITRRVTAPFAALFRSRIVVPVLVAFAATCFWVLFRHGLASATRQAFDSPELLLAVFALTVASAGWHEFGHAAACRAAGATPGAMGAGLYMVWPAFYTDVDDACRLGRWGRLKVDLGGLYFNAVVVVAVMGVWLIDHVDALLLVVVTQLVQMLRQLAPVIRADGYHILSDLIGVPDLFQHIKPTLAGLLPRNWGRPQPLRPAARWTVRAWVLLVVPLLLWVLVLTVLVLPRVAATAWVGLQQQQAMLAAGFEDVDALAVLAALLRMFSLALPVAASTYLLVRIVRRATKQVWARTDGYLPARAATILLIGVVVIALTLAWWPSGQYIPVGAEEQGTIDEALQVGALRHPPARGMGTNSPSIAERQFRAIRGVRPQSGYALVPRDPDEATLLVVRNDEDGELRSIVTGSSATRGEAEGVAFPFNLPKAPGEGDNQALAVNTGDGTVVYDVSVALVWVKDGEVVDNRNEAYALASCTTCTTVAVAFQVVAVVGETDVVAPINVAVATNAECISCQTLALAVQLVVTLAEKPSEQVQREIKEALGRLDGVTDVGMLYDEIKAVEKEIVTVLSENGLIEEDAQPAATTEESSSSAATSTSTTSAPTTTAGEAGNASTSTSTSTTSSTSISTTSSTSTSTSTSTTTTTTQPTTTSTP